MDYAAGFAALIPPTDLERLPESRVVVGIDDAGSFDPALADRLHHLARAGRVLAVAVVCEGEWVPEGIGRLWLDGLAERIEVRPFRDDQIADVLRARLGSDVDAEAVRGMGMLTGGNAMLLRELTEHAVKEGSLRRDERSWHWSGLSCVDGRLADVVRMRLGRLTEREAELVDLVALAGTLRLDTVPGYEDAVESLSRRGVLTADTIAGVPGVRYTFPLCGDVVMAAIPELTARRLRTRLAGAGQFVPLASESIRIPVRLARRRSEEPGREVVLAGPPSLTPREREVATYAAKNLTSRVIAELLVVSVRTVENHLQRAYTKLGITRRADLHAALASVGRTAAAVPRRPRDTAS
ncbi:helix-turn-helix transcriptional regulator [Amycolatopsis thailandensis]|uniref:helix-turn-helix transcriptional regulator n=1 Tax=Amycolatopsis thailandensis TaxID=589330 RepID=UPI0036369565